MKKIALIYDQHDCSGCHACEVACKMEHGFGVGPRVVRVIETSPLFVPMFCHHCEDSPCAISCPEDAITRDQETGVVLHDPEKCNGCNAVEGKSGIEKNQTSPCKVECPAKNDIQGFVSLTAKGKYEDAIKLIRQTSPFPAVCGRVCPHPCESKCNREQIDDPVSIQSIERFLADKERKEGKPYIPKVNEAKDEKIAIIGSGPAGFSAAYALAKEGYKVTVFEKLPVAGGMMAVGIPEYRLPRDVLASEIKVIQDMGVEIRTGVTFGEDITIDSLKKDGFEAIFIATGLHKERQLDVENQDMEGVLHGIHFLRDVSLGNSVSVGKRVVVIGGGNVAIDVALTALRKGAEDVTVVCLEQKDEMPAWESEITEALEEGVKIINGYGPNKFLEKKGKLSGVEFKGCTCLIDDVGCFNPEYDDTDLIQFEADTVILAIGQAADLSFAEKQGISVSSSGTLEVDPITLETSIEGVFVGGDLFYGPKTVADAIGSGKNAALSIDRYINGLDLRAGRLFRDNPIIAITEPQKENYDPAARVQAFLLDPKERIKGFDEVRQGLTEKAAVQEAKRCISCGSSCVQACPYGVMQFNHEVIKAVKCDLCIDRRQNNEAPACSLVCPSRCIYWGDPEELPDGIDNYIQKSMS